LELEKIDSYSNLIYRNVTLTLGTPEQGEICSSSIPNDKIDFLYTTGLCGCLGVVFVLKDAISVVHIQSDLVIKLTGEDINSKIEEKFNMMLSEVSKKSNIPPSEIDNLSKFYNIGEIFLISASEKDKLLGNVINYLNQTNINRKYNIKRSLSKNFSYNISKTPKLPEKIFSFNSTSTSQPIERYDINPKADDIDIKNLGI
jgi:hypothetical protein